MGEKTERFFVLGWPPLCLDKFYEFNSQALNVSFSSQRSRGFLLTQPPVFHSYCSVPLLFHQVGTQPQRLLWSVTQKKHSLSQALRRRILSRSLDETLCLFSLLPQNRKQSRGDVLLFSCSPTPGSIPRRGALLCGVCILSLCERVWVLSRGNFFSFHLQYKSMRVRLTGVSKSSVSVTAVCCFSRSVARGGWDRLQHSLTPSAKEVVIEYGWINGWMDGNNAGTSILGSNFWKECSMHQPAALVELPRNGWLKPRRILDEPILEWQQVS